MEPRSHTVPLRGVSFLPIEGKQVLQLLEVGDELELVRVRDNIYDPFAVRVRARGTDIGWIAREFTPIIGYEMDHGHRFRCTISARRSKYDVTLYVEEIRDALSEGKVKEDDQQEHQ